MAINFVIGKNNRGTLAFSYIEHIAIRNINVRHGDMCNCETNLNHRIFMYRCSLKVDFVDGHVIYLSQL